MLKTYMLFVVFGASGAGKSEILKVVTRICPQATIHKKFSTRERRPQESAENYIDLELVKEINTEACEVVYWKYENYYGVRKDLLEQAYRNKEIHFVIVRDIQAIGKLKVLHPELKTVYVHTDPHTLQKQLQAREGVSKQDRLKRIQQEYQEYIDHCTMFDHVVLNFWDLENAVKQLEKIINMYHKMAVDCLT